MMLQSGMIENNRQIELENESSKLMNELKQINKLAQDRAAFDYAKREEKATQTKLNTMRSAYGNDLSSVLGKEVSWGSLGADFQKIVASRAEAITNAKNDLHVADKQLQEVETKLKDSRARLGPKKKEFEKRQEKVLNSVLDDNEKPLVRLEDYPAGLEALEEDCKIVENDLLGLAYRKHYFDICRKTIEKENACDLCERPFAAEKEKSAALKKIEKNVKGLVRKQFEEDLAGLKVSLSKAVAARPDYEISKTLIDEIAELEKEIRALDRTRSPLQKKADALERDEADAVTAHQDLETLGRTVKTTIGYMEDLSELEGKISELSSQHKLTGSTLSPEEIDQRQSVCGERLHTVKTEISRITHKREQAKHELTRLEIELPKITSKLNDAGYKLEKKQALLSAVEQLRKDNAELKNRIQEADNALDALAPELTKENLRFEEAGKRGRAKENEVQSQRDKITDTVNKFAAIEKEINRYIAEEGALQLAACERAIQVLQQEQERLQTESNELAQNTNKLKDLIAEAEQFKRSIVDNIQYRKDVRDLEAVNTEISNMDIHTAADDHARLLREAKNAQREVGLLNVEFHSLAASMGEKDTHLKQSLEVWETDYKHAAQNYREARVQVGTAQAAIEDLGKYSSALEAAVMKFHSVKMEEINRVAQDLWQATYQGSDIDTIMVRSENENAASKKSYNYRVVMVKGDAEMDMRGRCSAGQKVLACIIIRLALAECFGVNCGVSPFPLSKH
jgi:DNA repair protein RAD50